MMRDDLKARGVPVFETMIRRTLSFPKAVLKGVVIRELKDAIAKAAWAEYQALGAEIMEVIK